MRDLDLISLRLFIQVCEAGSISRVAADETIVVSAISKRLTQLEATVGAKLLTRGKTGVKRTPAGETLLQHAYELREKIADIERDMSEQADFVHGRVRLFAAATAVAEFLPEDLASFLQVPVHLHIRVDLEEHLSQQVVFGVRQGVAQLGICWDVVDCEGLQTREYRHDQLGIAVHRSHALAGRRKLSLKDTLGYDHIGTRSSAAFQVAVAQSQQHLEKSMRYRAVVAGFDAAIRLAHAGLGIAVVPREMVKTFRRVNDMAFIPLTDSWARRRFVVCAKDFRALTPAARMLLDHLTSPASKPFEQIGASPKPSRSATRGSHSAG
jgi:DNA-binding transcriptional LysR family regulator